MLQLTSELNTWRVVFVSKGFCLFVWLNHIIMLHPSNLKWAKHLKFFIPIFFRKISAGDEIQLLIGDLFQFPSIFCVMLCSPKNSNQTSQQPLKLCGPGTLSISPMVGPKRNLRACFDLGTFGWMWAPEATKRKFIQASKQDNQAKFFWPEKKGGGCLEDEKTCWTDFLLLISVSCWKTSSSLMDENANGLKFFPECCSAMSEFCLTISGLISEIGWLFW